MDRGLQGVVTVCFESASRYSASAFPGDAWIAASSTSTSATVGPLVRLRPRLLEQGGRTTGVTSRLRACGQR